jgi:hypothetical protein
MNGLAVVWAFALLCAWGAVGGLAARRWLFPDWRGIEQGALAFALGAAGLCSTMVLSARWLGVKTDASGWISLALAVAACAALLRRPVADTPPACDRPAMGRGELAAWALANAPVALLAIVGFVGDWPVHYWNATAIQNGALPLPYPSYPDFEVPYHYAVDLVAAVVGRAVPVHPEWIFDGLTLAAWNTCLILAARWIRDTIGVTPTRALAYALLGVFVGGGAMWLVFPWADNVGVHLLEAAGYPVALFKVGVWGHFTTVGGQIVNFPMIHYLFNPPVSVGLPIGLAFLHVYVRFQSERRRSLGVAAAALLGTLSIAHVALFVALGLSIGFHALLRLRKPRDVVETAGVALAALALGIALGGFFAAFFSDLDVPLVVWFGAPSLDAIARAIYYVGTFGVPGALGAVGAVTLLRRSDSRGSLLAVVAAVSFAVPHVVWYVTAPVDNLKFFTVTALALGLLAPLALERVRGRLAPPTARVVIAVLAAGCVATPVVHVAAKVATAPDYLESLAAGRLRPWPGVQPVSADSWSTERQVAGWLRRAMGAQDLLLVIPRDPREVRVLSYTGRFSASPHHPGYVGVSLHNTRYLPRREWFHRAETLDPEALCEQPGLWVYALEGALDQKTRARLHRTALRGGLALEHTAIGTDGRHLVYRACPESSGASKR